jgi:hypothetical protein
MMALPPGLDEDAAVTDLSALAAELSRRGYTADLDTCPGPCLIGHPDVHQPQRIYADGEFFTWGWITGPVAFSLRCLSLPWPPTISKC